MLVKGAPRKSNRNIVRKFILHRRLLLENADMMKSDSILSQTTFDTFQQPSNSLPQKLYPYFL